MSIEVPVASVSRPHLDLLSMPLIVPSFSSRDPLDIQKLYEDVSGDLYGVCLASAFDLHTGRLCAAPWDTQDVVFVDSGGYETNHLLAAAHPVAPTSAKWTRPIYRDFLAALPTNQLLVAVSFDCFDAVPDQIRLAEEDFAPHPHLLRDLLLKPPKDTDGFLHPEKSSLSAGALGPFDMIAVTDDELGDSLVDRCRTLHSLRGILRDAGRPRMPIHVLGSVTPACIIAYFLCGGMVFDGLNWHRYSYRECGPLVPVEAALRDGLWDLSVKWPVGQWRQNLRYLRRLQAALQDFLRCGNFDGVRRVTDVADAAVQLARRAGVDLATFTKE